MKPTHKAFGCGFTCGLLAALAGLVTIALTAERAKQGAMQQRLSDTTAPVDGDADITRAIEAVRMRHAVPALAAAVVTGNGLAAVGAAGWRRADSDVPVTVHDSWHLGSDTKAMTAMLAACLVEQGRLEWDRTLAEVFPEAVGGMDPAFRRVTLRQLLSHRAGFPANLRWGDFDSQGPVHEARVAALIEAAGATPEDPPGSVFRYSNLGYVIAGAMLERVLNQPWEAAITTRIFRPLGMSQFGFGGVGTPGKLDQPWGHRANGQPVEGNGPAVDNPPVIGPAGRVHCTLQTWALFIADQLRGPHGHGALGTADTYDAVQTPVDPEGHALGWVVTDRGWAGGRALNHCGSNTMNYANAWLAPERGFAILVVCNQGGDAAFKATDDAVAALIPFAQRRAAEARPQTAPTP